MWSGLQQERQGRASAATGDGLPRDCLPVKQVDAGGRSRPQAQPLPIRSKKQHMQVQIAAHEMRA